MNDELPKVAITHALAGNWEEAKKINLQILREEPKNIDALNRLARACIEMGKIDEAKRYAKKALKVDPYNLIAKKSLEKWGGLKDGKNGTNPSRFTGTALSPNAFLEEPGKTKIVNLINLGDEKILAQLDAGDEVKMNAFTHRVSICTNDGSYVGRLPDDLAAHVRKLVKHGNEYVTLVKSSDKEDVKIFIKEVKKSKKLAGIPSFSGDKTNYVAFTDPELVRKKEDVMIPETEEES